MNSVTTLAGEADVSDDDETSQLDGAETLESPRNDALPVTTAKPKTKTKSSNNQVQLVRIGSGSTFEIDNDDLYMQSQSPSTPHSVINSKKLHLWLQINKLEK